MSDAPPLHVAIVGCGVAGLTVAFTLLERGRARGAPVHLTLFDAESRAGGVVRTERDGGFIIEGGPDCFIIDKPWGLDLCRRLGLAEELISTNPACRQSFLLRGGRLLPVPEGFQLMAPSSLLPFAMSPALSWSGKARAAMDLVLPRGAARADESLASFVRRRFGDEVLERLAQPLLAGIYNAEPERLSLRATMPRFLDLERDHRSVILGLMRGRRRAASGASAGVSGARYSLFVAPRRGMESIIERLVQALPGDALHLATRVTSVGRGPQGRRYSVATARGESLPFDAVVLALGAPAAAALLRPLDPEVSAALARVPCGDSTTVSLAWRQEDLPRMPHGFGFVVPRAERRRLIACSFSSVKFPGRAPEGLALLRAFTNEALVGGAGAERAIACAREELREILGIETEPILARAFAHPAAMPQYEPGHLELAAEIESRLERHAGLALAGSGLRGIGVPDCIRSGEAAADRLLSQAAALVA